MNVEGIGSRWSTSAHSDGRPHLPPSIRDSIQLRGFDIRGPRPSGSTGRIESHHNFLPPSLPPSRPPSILLLCDTPESFDFLDGTFTDSCINVQPVEPYRAENPLGHAENNTSMFHRCREYAAVGASTPVVVHTW